MQKTQMLYVLIQFFLPIFCSGTILTGAILFLYIFLRNKDPLYLSTMVIGLVGFLFISSEGFIIFFGSWLKNINVSVQFHRIEQLAGLLFIFVIPYFLSNLLKLNNLWRMINRLAMILGLIFIIIVTIFAFINPDSFISISKINIKENFNNPGEFGRGEPGLFYTIRDIILGILMIYTIIVTIIDLVIYNRKNILLMPLIGIIFAFYFAVDDIINVYFHIHITIFPSIEYSRTSLGISLFIFFSMAGLTRNFVDKAKYVEKALGALKNSEEKFRQLTENISEVFWVLGTDNTVHYISPGFMKIWGFNNKELYSNNLLWLDSIINSDLKFVKNSLKKLNEEKSFTLEYKIAREDHIEKWIRDRFFPIKDRVGKVFRWARVSEDITEYKKAENDLIYLASYDLLTGLPNRKTFYEKLNEYLLIAERSITEKLRVLFFIDLENLKTINDTLGHTVGDKILIEVSNRFKKCIRKTDYIFRLGGDEFTILLTSISKEIDSARIAQNIIDKVNAPYYIENHEIFIGINIGISIYPKDGVDANTLIKNADTALSEAKKDSNKFVFYNHTFNSISLKKMKIENNLRKAIDRNELMVYYQPIINIDGNIIGMEALIRWKNIDMGFVSPVDFIPVAEDSGLIIPIGEWIIKKVNLQIKDLDKNGFKDLKVAINLSTKQFKQKNFIDMVEKIIKEIDINPSSIEFEITESCMMDDPEDVIYKMNILHEKGINFSIDDFGTGYSSLSYIKKLPINKIKIDQSFIQEVLVNSDVKEIIKAIIAMSHNLELIVLAEGVETKEQFDLLKSLNCDQMQGFYFSKPLTDDQILILLNNSK